MGLLAHRNFRLTAAHCRHVPLITGSDRQAAQHQAFKWVNTLLDNIKNALPGSFHATRGNNVPRYLAEFEYRFNRRFDLPAMIERLTFVALRTPPMPYRLLKLADIPWQKSSCPNRLARQ
jgi:hypothetical protein